MSDPTEDQVTEATRTTEAEDEQVRSGADREPTADEEAAAERADYLDPEVAEHYEHQALVAGAAGYLSKATSATELVDQLEVLARGEQVVAGPHGTGRSPRDDRGWPGRDPGLSEREAEVVALAALGRRNAQIAEALFVSVDTVKTHLARSFRKLGVHNRTELSALIHRRQSFRRLLPDAE